MDILHSPEGLLPQTELGRDPELLEPRFHVKGKGLWLLEVGLVALVGVLVQVRQVVPDDLANTLELRVPLVGQAEVVRPVRRHGVKSLEPRVVSQNVQGVPVRLPEELEPRHDFLSLLSVLGVVPAHVAQHEVLRRRSRLEVFHLVQLLLLAPLRRQAEGLVALFLRLLRSRVRHLEKPLDDLLQTLDVVLLARVPVLDETVLEQAAGLELHAQVHVLEHDELESLLPLTVALAREDIVQGLQGRLALANADELLRALQGVLGLGETATSAVHRDPLSSSFPPSLSLDRSKDRWICRAFPPFRRLETLRDFTFTASNLK